jgi:nitrate reductase NapD
MNVSSIVVQALPEYIDGLVEEFKNGDVCDYHFHDKETGKIIVTIEGEGVTEEIAKLKIIEKLPHVIAADMMMAYSEDELESERDKIETERKIPAMLNDNSIKAEDIVYQGDLRKKDI